MPKPLTQAEREYINRFLHGNMKKQEKREANYVAMINKRNDCLEVLETLDRLPGSEQLKQQLVQRVNQVDLKVSPDEFSSVRGTLEKLEKELKKEVARQLKTPLAQEQLAKQGQCLQDTLPNPPGRAERLAKEVNRGFMQRGTGPKFGKVIDAMKAVEKEPSEKHLAALERLADDYLKGYDEGDNDNDDITKRKAAICREALKDVAAQRKYARRLSELKPPPWSGEEEIAVRALQAEMLLDRNPAKKLGAGESGASESFFLPGRDGPNQFIFKPADGENVSGYGWTQGGGAPREVAVSSMNESLKEFGLDCGVSKTSLVSVDNPSLATPRNGNRSQRVGAIQDFVPQKMVPDLTVGGQNKMRALNFADVFNPQEGDPRYEIPKKDAQKVLVLDFVSLQLDRNDGNVLFQEGPGGNPKMVPIDAGNALPNRDAWESRRRTFANQALFKGPVADQPFDPEIKASIESMDPDKIAASLTTAKQQMSGVDPNVSAGLEDQSIEMSRRSAMFLKRAVAVLGTPKELAEGYAHCLQKVFDAPARQVEAAIEEAIRETRARLEQKRELERLNYEAVLAELAWPYDIEFGSEDPQYLLSIVRARKPNPAAQRQVAEWVRAQGGLEAVRTAKRGWDGMNLAEQLREVRRSQALTKTAYEANLRNENGDQVLQEAGIDASEMTPRQKADAMWQVLYERLGGDARIAELREREGLAKIPSARMGAGPMEWVDNIRAWDEYQRLGGSRAHVQLGGTGAPGSGDPKILLHGLRTLTAQYEVRCDEVRESLRAAQELIGRESQNVGRMLTVSAQAFDEAVLAGEQLPAALARGDQDQLQAALETIGVKRQALQRLAERARVESARIEREFYAVLPTKDVADRHRGGPGRAQLIQNGIDRLVNDLTGERQPIQNYARWLDAYLPVEQFLLRGGERDPLLAVRPVVQNAFRKLAIREFPPIQGAESRIGTLLDGLEERVKKAEREGASPTDKEEIDGRMQQIEQELPRLLEVMKVFLGHLSRARTLLTPEVRQRAATENGRGQINENLAYQIRDLDNLVGALKQIATGAQRSRQALIALKERRDRLA